MPPDVPRENTVVDAIVRYLERRGAWVRKPYATDAGDPDLFVCHRGRFLAIEVKRPGGRPTRLQLWTLEQISKAGGHALVADSVDRVRQALDYLDSQEALHA